jgi:hypothetical protein
VTRKIKSKGFAMGKAKAFDGSAVEVNFAKVSLVHWKILLFNE